MREQKAKYAEFLSAVASLCIAVLVMGRVRGRGEGAEVRWCAVGKSECESGVVAGPGSGEVTPENVFGILDFDFDKQGGGESDPAE